MGSTMTEAGASKVKGARRAPLEPVEHFTVAERAARGKAARADVPRMSHAGWESSAVRLDPVELLEEQAKTRVAELVPIRSGRMLVSPVTFYISRGGVHHGRRPRGYAADGAASDTMLGWIHVTGVDGVERDFYVRQLWDSKGSALVDAMGPKTMEAYADICGQTLARASALRRAVAISGYLGASDDSSGARRVRRGRRPERAGLRRAEGRGRLGRDRGANRAVTAASTHRDRKLRLRGESDD